MFTDDEKVALVLYYTVKHSVFATSLQNNYLALIFYPIFGRSTCHDLFFSNDLDELNEVPGYANKWQFASSGKASRLLKFVVY